MSHTRGTPQGTRGELQAGAQNVNQMDTSTTQEAYSKDTSEKLQGQQRN